MNYGYIRVSSDKQTVENQRFEINNFCRKHQIKVDGWIEETISGTKSYNKREFGKLIKQVRQDDLIICAELCNCITNISFSILFKDKSTITSKIMPKY